MTNTYETSQFLMRSEKEPKTIQKRTSVIPESGLQTATTAAAMAPVRRHTQPFQLKMTS